ncbi:hypothetical protein BP6252_13879 [Coleophoma cylindrospora]|uniref:Uncharacterized protein n=1 Tax=Coleophoma cylindrospora TaxID=1849047 RepID=A0A3D8Q6M6_9HELO|nr:hypothetical protein BP6252_13879 [Coleophoma cylindrospora]
MPYLSSADQKKGAGKGQLSDIETELYAVVARISGRLSGLEGSAYYQQLLTLLVGIGLILHSFWLFLLIFHANLGTLFLLFDGNKFPAINASDMAAEENKSVPNSSQSSPVSDTPSLTAAKAIVSREGIILNRLAELSKERHVSPMIFEAATRQDYMTCSRLIQEGVDCDIPGPCGINLVHVAAMNGNMQLLSILISSSQKIWSACDRGKLPLDYAAFNNHLDVVEYLAEQPSFLIFVDERKLAILERSAEFAQCRGHIGVANYLSGKRQSIKRTQKRRLFKSAVSQNNIKLVEKLLREGISERSALQDACESGFIPMVSILLSSTFDGFSYNITTAISFAAATGQQDLLVLLLCAIYDVPERSRKVRLAYLSSLGTNQVKICEFLVLCGEIDIHYAFKEAANSKNLHLLRWMIQKEGKEKLHGATLDHTFRAVVLSQHSLPVIQFLVENGADVNSENKIWGSALQCAAAKNDLDLVQYLVSKGANINALGRFGGSSPAMAAVSGGSLSTFHYFLSLQSCLDNQRGSFGNILQTASYLGRTEFVEDILNSGFDVNAHLKPYGSALIMAIQGGSSYIAELLISRGANVNIAIPKYGTALHIAAAAGREDIVKSLIRAGANVNVKEGDFGTPLQAAAANGYQLIVLFLLDCGAEVNAVGGKYGNALQAAQVGSHSLLAKLLLFSGAKVTKEVY